MTTFNHTTSTDASEPSFTDCRQATRCASGSGTRSRLNGRVLYFTYR